MADGSADPLWDEDAPPRDPAFRRQLWSVFGVFALLVILALGVLAAVSLNALRDKALSVALARGQESADEMARILQEEAEKRQGDLYTIVRDRQEVDDVLGESVGQRRIVDSWQILDAEGEPLMTNTRIRSGGKEVQGAPGDPPIHSKEFLTVERELLLGGKRAGLVRLFLSEPDMMRQVEEFQRDVRLKVLAATAATLTLLLAGFAYVARTLDRTQRIHDQAEARLRLASLGALAGGLAHEIRNPLNAMNMNIQLLEEDIAATRGDAPRGQWQETLRATRHEIRRLDELVQNVLTFSRPFEIHVAPVALRELVGDLVAFMQPEVARAGVTVDVEIPGRTTVQADAAKLRQALLNVLRNALQAIQASGERGHVRIGFRTEGGVAMLTLEDDGPGIPAGERDRLFRAFASTKPGGTGLGLPIARKVLRAHGGDLQLQPATPRGTRVTLSLPA